MTNLTYTKHLRPSKGLRCQKTPYDDRTQPIPRTRRTTRGRHRRPREFPTHLRPNRRLRPPAHRIRRRTIPSSSSNAVRSWSAFPPQTSTKSSTRCSKASRSRWRAPTKCETVDGEKTSAGRSSRFNSVCSRNCQKTGHAGNANGSTRCCGKIRLRTHFRSCDGKKNPSLTSRNIQPAQSISFTNYGAVFRLR